MCNSAGWANGCNLHAYYPNACVQLGIRDTNLLSMMVVSSHYFEDYLMEKLVVP